MDKLDKIQISEFSRMSGINLANLRYYDSIGLLSPKSRANNSYRHYSIGDLGKAFLIVNLRHVDLPIKKIIDYFEIKDQGKKSNFLNDVNDDIEKEIHRLKQIQESLNLYSDIEKNINLDKLSNIEIKFLNEKPILSRYSNSDSTDYISESTSFFEYVKTIGLNPSYPFGQIVTKDNLSYNNINNSLNFYFSAPRHLSNDKIPSAKYVIAHQLGDIELLQKKVFSFIEINNLEIIGNGYVEYIPKVILNGGHEDNLISFIIPIA